LIDTVTDKEILAAYRALAEVEGIFVSPRRPRASPAC